MLLKRLQNSLEALGLQQLLVQDPGDDHYQKQL